MTVEIPHPCTASVSSVEGADEGDCAEIKSYAFTLSEKWGDGWSFDYVCQGEEEDGTLLDVGGGSCALFTDTDFSAWDLATALPWALL